MIQVDALCPGCGAPIKTQCPGFETCFACECDRAFAVRQGQLPIGLYANGTPIYAGDKTQQHPYPY